MTWRQREKAPNSVPMVTNPSPSGQGLEAAVCFSVSIFGVDALSLATSHQGAVDDRDG
jgi:hypothetical protein